MATLKYKDPILGWQTLAIDGGVTDVQIIPAAYGESPSARITAGTLYITWPADLQLDSTLSSASAAAPAGVVGGKFGVDEIRIASIETAVGEEATEKIGTYTTGHYWNSETSVATDATSTNYTEYSAIAVTPGRKYILKVRAGSSAKQKPLLFVDGSNNIISKHGASSATTQTITAFAPIGAVNALITAGTTDEATLANTSFQEFVVQDLSDLPSQVDDMDLLSFSLFQEHTGFLGSEGKWLYTTNNTYKHKVIEVNPGDEVKFKTTGGSGTYYYGFLTTYTEPVSGETIPYSAQTGFTERLSTTLQFEVIYTVPSDAHYMVLQMSTSGGRISVATLKINGMSILSSAYDRMDELYKVSNEIIPLKSNLDAFINGSNEVPIAVGSVSERYVNYANGKMTAGSDVFGHVGFFNIEGYPKIKYSRVSNTTTTSNFGIAFYSGEKWTGSYISGISALTSQAEMGYVMTEVDVPSGAKYVALSAFLDTTTYGNPQLYGVVENAVLDDIADLQSAIGTVPSGETVESQIDALKTSKADIIYANASGAIASFPDGADVLPAESVVVNIDPVQDLHGYDSPWPAGGGKNKLRPMTVGSGSSKGVDYTVYADGTVKLNGTATGTISLYIIGTSSTSYGDIGIATGEYKFNGVPADGHFALYCVDNDGNSTSVQAGLDKTLNIDSTKTYRVFIRIDTGVTVTDEIASPMIRVSTDDDPTYAPYSNICPITGWTGANVTRAGKNLFDKTGVSPASTVYGNKFFFKAGTTYCFSIDSSDTVASIAIYDETKTTQLAYASGPQYVTYTPTSDIYGYPRLYKSMTDGGVTQAILDKVMLEIGSRRTDYTAYSGTTYTISWQTEAGTVYGGTLDVTTGVLTVTHGIVDLGDLEWEDSGYRSNSFRTRGLVNNGATTTNAISSQYVITDIAVANMQNGTMRGIASHLDWWIIVDENYNDPATFKTAMSGVQLIYKLATPVTYQLTPTEVTLLLGDNNIWADTGDTAVEYRADTEKYIERYVAAHDVDVQINGTSIVNSGVANIPLGAVDTPGVVYPDNSGLTVDSTGKLKLNAANAAQVKTGTTGVKAITPARQHDAAFYGLAKAAGDSTQAASANAVGTYTESAKSAIASMLDAPETVSGSTPSIAAKAGVRYICGECSTLTITTPASGIIDVIFESGSTPTVLTVTPPTGMTMKWVGGFDPANLEEDTVYEINIMDGVYGVVGKWT